jgi:hypothetical protein
MSKTKEEKPYDEDQIPLFSSWKGWYWLNMLVLLALILLFYWFTQHYS